MSSLNGNQQALDIHGHNYEHPPPNQHSVHFEWHIQQFIHKVNSRTPNDEVTQNFAQTKLPLAVVKRNLVDASSTIQELHNEHDRLQTQINSMSTADWENSLSVVAQRRLHLQHLLNSIPVDSVQVKHAKRLKKRRRLQRTKADRHKMSVLLQNRRNVLHSKIDAWQQQRHTEDAARKQAQVDAERISQVLSIVNKKQSDARKQIAVLSALVELRRARSVQATGKGAKASSKSEEMTFVLEIDKLKAIWQDALQNYEREADELRRCVAPSSESLREDWHRVLFGSDAGKDLARVLKRGTNRTDALVDIRLIWDMCLVPADHPMGTSIPMGWVTPSTEPSLEWAAYRQANN